MSPKCFKHQRCKFDHNNITSNSQYGIYFRTGSYKNKIYSNYFSNNLYGLRLSGSTNNDIFNNIIIKNNKGIYLCCGSMNNKIYNNNFIKNDDGNANADDSYKNQWDDGIKKGNYWDDYEIKYSDAIEVNGIWNKPYQISENNQDRYPLFNKINISIN